jgi:hypothetical protein
MARFSQPDPKTRYKTSKPGINTQRFSDGSSELGFNNFNYLGREYIGEDYKTSSVSGAVYDNSGYITNLGSSSGTAGNWFGYVVLANQGANLGTSGNLVMTWTGGGGAKPNIRGGGASLVTDGAQRRVYSFTDLNNTIVPVVNIASGLADSVLGNHADWASYEANPVRITEICFEELEGTTRWGQANFWRDDYIQVMGKFTGGIRVMNTLATNQQKGNIYFSNRKPVGFRTYAHGAFDGGEVGVNGRLAPAGTPFEVAIDLCNRVGVPCWFNIPYQYVDSTSSLEALANLIVEEYNPLNGVFGIEWSNEAWNSQFPHGDFLHTRGLIEDQNTSSVVTTDGRYGGDAYPEWKHAGLMSTSAMKVMGPIFDAASGTGFQYCRILDIQTGGTGRNQDPQDVNTSVPYDSSSTETAKDWHDAVALTGYWGSNLVNEPQFSDNGASANLLTRKGAEVNTVNKYVSAGITGCFNMWRDAEYAWQQENNNDSWERNRIQLTVDRDWEEILCYEGNHHMTWTGPSNQAPRLVQELVGNYSSLEWVELHGDFQKLWNNMFGGQYGGAYMHFVQIGQPAFGLRGYPETDDPTHTGWWGYCDSASSVIDADTDPYYNGRDYDEYNWYNSMRSFAGFSRKRSP